MGDKCLFVAVDLKSLINYELIMASLPKSHDFLPEASWRSVTNSGILKSMGESRSLAKFLPHLRKKIHQALLMVGEHVNNRLASCSNNIRYAKSNQKK